MKIFNAFYGFSFEHFEFHRFAIKLKIQKVLNQRPKQCELIFD